VNVTLTADHVAFAVPADMPVWDVDPYDVGILCNPEPYYAELRARGAFVYIPRYAVLATGRYQSVREVFSDWERFVSSRGVGLTDFKWRKPWRPPSIVLEVDPPYHTRTRSVIMRALSLQAIGKMKEMFKAHAESLVAALAERRTFDAVPDLAERFPTRVFPQAVGLTDIDARRLIDYGAMVFNALGPDNALRRLWLAKAPEIVPWITAACRRERLRPDGIGASIYEAADRGEISEEEAGMLVRSLLSAGVDTTVTGIGNSLLCLARNPGAYAQLRADPGLARAAFEETLRLTSPVHTFCRTASCDTEVCGVAIPRDAKILCVLGAANLDPERWPNPEGFDLTRRSAGGHLAFGVGIHACVGQLIARAEVDALLRAIATRVTSIELTGVPLWRPGNAIRSLESLPIRFGAP